MCSFCNLYDETPYHMLYECDRGKCRWSDLVQCFQNNLILGTLTPQTAIFGFLDYILQAEISLIDFAHVRSLFLGHNDKVLKQKVPFNKRNSIT